jgi:hypothetical protein
MYRQSRKCTAPENRTEYMSVGGQSTSYPAGIELLPQWKTALSRALRPPSRRPLGCIEPVRRRYEALSPLCPLREDQDLNREFSYWIRREETSSVLFSYSRTRLWIITSVSCPGSRVHRNVREILCPCASDDGGTCTALR